MASLQKWTVVCVLISLAVASAFAYGSRRPQIEKILDAFCTNFPPGAVNRPVHCKRPGPGCQLLAHNCNAVTCNRAIDTEFNINPCRLVDDEECRLGPIVECMQIDHYTDGHCNGAVICTTKKTIISCVF
jgi:hypothetical protein